LYGYLGLTALTITGDYIVYSVIGSVLLATIIGRLVAVFVPCFFIFLANKGELSLKCNELILVSVGGVIRGAIAFGLCLSIEGPHSKLVQITVQIIVLFTTVFFGSGMGLIALGLNLKPESECDHLKLPLIEV